MADTATIPEAPVSTTIPSFVRNDDADVYKFSDGVIVTAEQLVDAGSLTAAYIKAKDLSVGEAGVAEEPDEYAHRASFMTEEPAKDEGQLDVEYPEWPTECRDSDFRAPNYRRLDEGGLGFADGVVMTSGEYYEWLNDRDGLTLSDFYLKAKARQDEASNEEAAGSAATSEDGEAGEVGEGGLPDGAGGGEGEGAEADAIGAVSGSSNGGSEPAGSADAGRGGDIGSEASEGDADGPAEVTADAEGSDEGSVDDTAERALKLAEAMTALSDAAEELRAVGEGLFNDDGVRELITLGDADVIMRQKFSEMLDETGAAVVAAFGLRDVGVRVFDLTDEEHPESQRVQTYARASEMVDNIMSAARDGKLSAVSFSTSDGLTVSTTSVV